MGQFKEGRRQQVNSHLVSIGNKGKDGHLKKYGFPYKGELCLNGGNKISIDFYV